MIIATIILTLIIILVLWVIFVPVNIKVNTARSLYEIEQVGTVTISLHPGETHFVRLRVLGFSIDLPRKERRNGGEKKKVDRQQPKSRKSVDAWLYLFKGMTKSFCCRRFICNVDFDDAVLNAQLFPVGYLASREPVVLNINFEKKYLLDIWIQARIHQIVWTFIRFYLTK